ncbi:hypothetical protein BJ166DRAFT_12775 [Pestalotiopsis sp. NC0098]|nr:hypothetical protein BJ166DRAFT_12775 [Pestalotiopsis sp. NC0098]
MTSLCGRETQTGVWWMGFVRCCVILLFFLSYSARTYWPPTYPWSVSSFISLNPRKEPTEKENADTRRPGLWGWEAKWILFLKEETSTDLGLCGAQHKCTFGVSLSSPCRTFSGGVPFSARPREIFRVLLQPDPTPGPASESLFFFFFDGLGSSWSFSVSPIQDLGRYATPKRKKD